MPGTKSARNAAGRSLIGARAMSIALSAVAAQLITSLTSGAASVAYVGPSGLWSTASNWSSGTLPSTIDTAQLTLGTGSIKTVTFDNSASNTIVKSLVTDSLGANNLIIFNQNNKTFSTTIEQIGLTGQGVANYTGGSHSITGAGTNALYVGVGVGSSGTVNLGNATLTVADNAFVGVRGIGIFNQSNGNNNTNGFLTLGGENNGTTTAGIGTYNLSGGVAAIGFMYVGLSGTGTFNHTGGQSLFGNINIASLPGSTGAFNISSGVAFNRAAITIGDQGHGNFTMSGGSIDCSGAYLGFQQTGIGVFNISGGRFTVQGVEIVSDEGVSTITQTGGLHNPKDFWTSMTPNAISTINLSGGTMAVNSSEFLSFAGSTVFNQTGGTHTVGNYFSMGQQNSVTCTYNLSGGLFSAAVASIGSVSTTNIFNQTGGSNIRNGGVIYLGEENNSRGTYNLSGGSLLTDTLWVGVRGRGILNQSGANSTLNSLVIAGNAQASGTVTLSSGILNVLRDEEIGSYGKATFNQTGGTHNYSGTVAAIIANNPGSVGIYNLSGGTLNATIIENRGQLIVTGGSAQIDQLTGTGLLRVGNGTADTTVNVASLTHNTVVLNSKGILALNAPTTGDHFISSLTINGGTNIGGLLDIGNQNVYLDRAITPYSNVLQLVKTAGNISGFANPVKDIAPDYSARGGITSSVARTSALNSEFKYGIAVLDGEILDNTLGFVAAGIATGPGNNGNASNSANFPGGDAFPAVPTNRVFVAPVLYGDFNADGVVNDTDIFIFVSLGAYGNSTTYGWIVGDLNNDGVVDDTDVTIFIGAGNYNPDSKSKLNAKAIASKQRALTLTGKNAVNIALKSVRPDSSATSPSQTASGTSGDHTMAYIYDPKTGDVKIRYNGDSRITSSNPLQFISIATANGLNLVSGALNSDGFLLTTYSSTTLNGATITSEIPDGYDLGNILPPYLDTSTLLNDLTLRFNIQGGGLFFSEGNLIVLPEPTALSLLGVGAVALLHRRRKRNTIARQSIATRL